MRTTKKKVLKAFIVLFFVLLMIAGLWACAYFHRSDSQSFVFYETSNPFIRNHPSQISAHRSGGGIVPEETMAAFMLYAQAENFTVDYFEFDLHLTADEELVLIHDGLLGRTSDCERIYGRDVVVSEMTLPQLKRLNMGAKFVDGDGNLPYADLSEDEVPDELRIATLEEVLDYLTSVGDYRYIVELKDSGERGYRSADKLYEEIESRDLLDKVIFSSFYDDVLQYIDRQYPNAYRGASLREVAQFFFSAIFKMKGYTPAFDVVQLPYRNIRESYGVNFGITSIINYAHSHNIAVQYWTINSEKDMKYLSDIGADAITTDIPDVLWQVLKN